MDLKGKTILVTGGRRVGQVVADELGSAGANVVMTYRESHGEIAEMVARLARTYRIRAEAYHLDLTDEQNIHVLVNTATQQFRSIDGLVNMASVFEPDPKDVTKAAVLRALEVPVGSILLSRRFAEEAEERGAKLAPIVSFIDWAVNHPYAEHDLYLASKGYLATYLRALQSSFAGTIRVVNISPGMILEPKDFPPAERRAIIENTPTKNIGDPEQAARLVRTAFESDFLAGDIPLDGGQSWRHRL